MTNPLLEEWNTPFGIPPFSEIKDDHFLPAFDKAFAEHNTEIDAIASRPEDPSFENTVEALERAGGLLKRISYIFSDRASANTNDTLREIQTQIAPRMAAHSSAILQNEELFNRINTIFESRETLGLSGEQVTLIEHQHKRFVRAGAALTEEARKEVADLDQEISGLTTTFGQNVLQATNAFELFLEEADIEGIPNNAKQAAAKEASARGQDGKYFFNTNRSSFMPLIQFADKREVREEIHKAKNANASGGAFDNRQIAARISSLRAQRAQLLGFKTHADYVLDERMAKSPEKATGLLKELWGPATKKAAEEAEDLQSRIVDDGGNFELAAWDWRYYTEKVRAERFDLDPDEVRQYFALDNVRDGVFDVANKLFGLEFSKIEDAPLPHEDCEAFEVRGSEGEHIGVFITDYFARPSKRDGAWMSLYRDQSRLDGEVRPIVKNTCNFPKPVDGEKALLPFGEVRTLFHEFGHALHGLLSDVTYESLSCTSVKWDFVELPSQIMEHWATEPEVLKSYARHAETGAAIPDEMIEKLRAADTFNQGYETTAYLASSFLDFAWCDLETTEEQNADTLEAEAFAEIGLDDRISPYHRSTYFGHVFSGGYSAGYYSYIWAAVLDCDGYEAFEETDTFDPATAKAFRDNILSKGGTEEPMELYKKFRGREPEIGALLKDRGLN